MPNLLHTGLLVHIIGFSLMLGATLGDFIVFRQLSKQVQDDLPKGLSLLNLNFQFSTV